MKRGELRVRFDDHGAGLSDWQIECRASSCFKMWRDVSLYSHIVLCELDSLTPSVRYRHFYICMYVYMYVHIQCTCFLKSDHLSNQLKALQIMKRKKRRKKYRGGIRNVLLFVNIISCRWFTLSVNFCYRSRQGDLEKFQGFFCFRQGAIRGKENKINFCFFLPKNIWYLNKVFGSFKDRFSGFLNVHPW